MDVKLRVLEGKHTGQEVAVTVDKFFIGRAEECHLRPGSDLVSRHHCVLLVEEGYLAVRDFGSKNGTYVNGERVLGERELKPGDRVKVGPLEFELVLSTTLGGKRRPPVSDVKEAAARAAEGGRDQQVDVTQWLAAEAGGKKGSEGETRRVDLGGTVEVSSVQTHDLAAPPEQPAEPVAAEPADDEKKKGKKTPGKLPPPPSKATKDSREAATNILAMFRKQR